MLTAPIFTKTFVDGHLQGTNTLGKFFTHLYFQTDIVHNSADALYKDIMNFFLHYTDNPDYELTSNKRYKQELQALKRFAEKEYDMKTCEKLFRSIRTNTCESKFSTRLKYIPKHKNFPKHFKTRTHLVDLCWDESHISKYVLEKYGNIHYH